MIPLCFRSSSVNLRRGFTDIVKPHLLCLNSLLNWIITSIHINQQLLFHWCVHNCPAAQLSSELQQHPELLNDTDSELMQSLIEGNYSIPNTSTLLEQLDTIDNAACGWTRFMSKVRRVKNGSLLQLRDKIHYLIFSLQNSICTLRRKSISLSLSWVFNRTSSPLWDISGQCGRLQRFSWRGQHCQLYPQPGLSGQCLRVCQ